MFIRGFVNFQQVSGSFNVHGEPITPLQIVIIEVIFQVPYLGFLTPPIIMLAATNVFDISATVQARSLGGDIVCIDYPVSLCKAFVDQAGM